MGSLVDTEVECLYILDVGIMEIVLSGCVQHETHQNKKYIIKFTVYNILIKGIN